MSVYTETSSAATSAAKPDTGIYCVICGEGDRVPGLLVCKDHLEEAKAKFVGFDRPYNPAGLFVVNVKHSHGGTA